MLVELLRWSAAVRRTRSSRPGRPPRRPRTRSARGCAASASSSAISSAISRIVDVPEPLSLMPGPSSTESRWAPTTIVRSAFALPRVGDHVVLRDRCGRGVDDNVDASPGPSAPGRTSSSPTSLVIMIAGIVDVRRRRDEQRILTAREAVVEDQRRDRAGVVGVLVLLHERAGAALHQRDLAGWPPAKSAGVAAAHRRAGPTRRERRCCRRRRPRRSRRRRRRTGRRCSRCPRPRSCGAGLIRSSVDGPFFSHCAKSNPSSVTSVAGGPQPLRDVGDRGVVARRRRGALAVVRDRDAAGTARSCSRMPSTVTPLRSFFVSTLSIAEATGASSTAAVNGHG